MGISLERLLRQLGINPGDVFVNVPAGTTPFYGVQADPGAGTDKTQSYSLASGTNLDTRESFVVGWVIVDNNSSAWLNLPDCTRDGTGRFVGPGQGGSFPILGHISRSRAVWAAPPGKSQPVFVAGEQAQLIFGAGPLPPGLGFASPIPLKRWNISSQPATGAQATATKAAAAGVTHVADFFFFNLIAQAGAAAANPAVNVRDGASGVGSPLFPTNDGSTAAAGSNGIIFGGPQLAMPGTAGNAMTAEFGAGVANYIETVSLNGYDL